MFSLRNSLAVDQRLAGRRYSGCSGLPLAGWGDPARRTVNPDKSRMDETVVAFAVTSLAAAGVHHPVA
jgi:hypothetical protein